MSYYSHMPDDIVEQIISKKCILFIGAGISKKCITDNRKNLPNWYEFLKEFIEWKNNMNAFEPEYFSNLLELLKENKYLIVAEELIKNINEVDFKNFLERVFNARNISPSRLHKLIAMLPFRGIITTNYDNLIELSYVQSNKKIPKIYNNLDIINGVDPLNSEFFILKMHGDIDDPKSIVLSYSSYIQLMYNSSNYQNLLQKIFSEYSVLFIGYGGTDNNIEFILDKASLNLQKTQHYILARKNAFNLIEKNHYKNNRKVDVIDYVDYFNLHNHIDTFFCDIADKLIEQKVISDVKPKELRTLMNVYYDELNIEDGAYLKQYFFKEGAVTLVVDPKEQYDYFISKPIKELTCVSFIIFYIGLVDTIENNEYYIKIDKILKSKIKHNCKFIFLSLDSNKKFIKEHYKGQTVFYVRKNFTDIDLDDMKNYILNKF